MKQRHSRIGLKNSVALFWHGLNTPANIENISVTGVLLRADLPVRIGEFMSVHLRDKAVPEIMQIRGEVVRIGEKRRGMPTFVLQFFKIPEELRVFLLHSLAKHGATREA